MSTADQGAAFFWRSFADLADEPEVRLHPDGYAVIYLGTGTSLNVHLHTRAQCDTAIKAFTAARDLLAEGEGAAEAAEPEGPDLLTIDTTASVLQCSKMHVYRLIESGALIGTDVSASGARSKMRVRSDSLAAFIDSRTGRRPRQAEPPLVMAPECARGNHGACWTSADDTHICECCMSGHPGAPLPAYTEVPGIAHCAPGDCTCGGHVDAEGVFHAAAVAL